MSTRPLADEIRPQRLDEVVGQRHLIGPGGVLRRLIDAGTSANMIFYGPSGTGKTTIANIIANKTNKTLYRLNATTASLQDVKDIIASVGTLMAPGGILLYLDEIQYFNKKQQQSLLEFMENGSITLIASTTENPFFYVYNALLSRSTVFEFKQVEPREIIAAAIELAQAGKLADLPHRGDVAAGAIHRQDALRLVARNASVVIQIEHSETESFEGGICEGDINTLVLIILLVLSKAAGREQQQSENRDKAQHGRIRYSRRRRSRRRRRRNWRRPGFRRRP